MKKSAGLLLYRWKKDKLEVLLCHPGGPIYKNRDHGCWSIPKGEYDDNENPVDVAVREFEEEVGIRVDGKLLELTPVRQKSGKMVYAWAVEKDMEIDKVESNHFEMEWPPKSGKTQSFPEIDRVEWFTIPAAKEKIIPGQIPILDELETKLNL